MASITHVSFFGRTPQAPVQKVFATEDLGCEKALLSAVDKFVKSLALTSPRDPDAKRMDLLTWNGAGFDLGFVLRRAELLNTPLGLKATGHLPGFAKYPDTHGRPVPLLDASWWGLPHRDIAYEYQDLCVASGEPWALKPVSRARGIEVIELERARMDMYANAEITAYALSDARATYLLTELLDESA